jgi:hypothetical protein
MALRVCQIDPFLFGEYIHKSFYSDDEIVLTVVKNYPSVVLNNRLSIKILDLILPIAIRMSPSLFHRRECFGRSEEWVLDVINVPGLNLNGISPKLLSNPKFILKAMRKNNMVIDFIKHPLLDEKGNVLSVDDYREFGLEAISIYSHAYIFFGGGLKNDKKIILKSVRNNPDTFHYLEDEFKKDLEVYLAMYPLKRPRIERLCQVNFYFK